MQTVPPALDRGTGLPAKWETLGTEVPRKLMALAGTGHGSAEEVEETGHWTHSSASSSQDTGHRSASCKCNTAGASLALSASWVGMLRLQMVVMEERTGAACPEEDVGESARVSHAESQESSLRLEVRARPVSVRARRPFSPPAARWRWRWMVRRCYASESPTGADAPHAT